MKNPKRKGNSFERFISKFLDNLFETKDSFWRTYGSGMLATIGRKNNSFHGDVCAIRPEFNWFNENFFIECKYLKKINIFSKEFEDICKKAIRDANGKKILLFIKENNKITNVYCNFEIEDWKLCIRINNTIFYCKKIDELKKEDILKMAEPIK